MRIIFFGTPPFVIPVLEVLRKKFSVIAVVTGPDKKAGRKQLVTPSSIKKYSSDDKVNIPVLTPTKFDEEAITQLKALQPDLFVVAAYGYILPKEVLTIPPFGAINVHPSLLPKFRGPTPVPSALLSGDVVTGVTIIKMDEEMDHGPILSMQSYQIHETDTTETLLTHLFNLSAEMLPDVITNYTNGKIQPETQDESKATYTKLISKADGMIDVANPPDKKTLDTMIRAYYPWPAVWTTVRSKKQEARIRFLPGGRVQMEGRSPVSIKDFLNGYPEMKTLINKFLVTLDS